MNRKFNVLQITTHDSGRHFGCYGHKTLNTPNIDALAGDGVRLSNYFTVVPICSPSRGTMLTGRYPQSHGLLDLPGFGWRLHDEERHMAQIMREAGYDTFLFGIQHEVARQELNRLKFGEIFQNSSQCNHVADNVADFLKNRASGGKPFYAQVGFRETHTPFEADGTEPDVSRGIEIPPYLVADAVSQGKLAYFQGAIRRVDEAVGVIVEALRKSGCEDDTLMVFTTDHGVELPRAKWTLYDPGIAIAFVLRCPSTGLTGGKECDLLLSNVDYLPTVLEIIGLPVPGNIQGRSFAHALRENDGSPLRDAVYGMYHKTQTRCVRTQQFKLIRHFDVSADYHTFPVRYEDVLNRRVMPRLELYDLRNDPDEIKNLSGSPEHAGTQSQLDGQLWEWMESVDDPLLKGPIPAPTLLESLNDYQQWKQTKK